MSESRAGVPLVISSYAAARSILVNPAARVLADPGPPSAGTGPLAALVERGAYLRNLWMWGCDPERRAIRRKAAASALGQAPVESLVPYLKLRAAALLDAKRDKIEIDLVGDYARPLVRDALMELFGIVPALRASLDAQVAGMAGFIPGAQSNDTIRYFALAATARFVEETWQKPLPASAATSRILRDAVETGDLTLDEALAQATLLLFGNSYTSLDALGGLLARLAEQPSLWQAARKGALSADALVEESLRLGPPAGLVLFRDAVEEIIHPGGTIAAGTRIVMPLDRLNRDPDCFAQADAFAPVRPGPPHLAFGAGRHMCVGLHLARTVIRTAIDALLGRLPEWPADIRISNAPGILGGSTVTHLAVPVGAFRPC